MISEMECSIHLALILMSCSNSDNSCFVMRKLTSVCTDSTDVRTLLIGPMTSKYGGASYHYLYILLSITFGSKCTRIWRLFFFFFNQYYNDNDLLFVLPQASETLMLPDLSSVCWWFFSVRVLSVWHEGLNFMLMISHLFSVKVFSDQIYRVIPPGVNASR